MEKFFLDDKQVGQITSYLTDGSQLRPYNLTGNLNNAFMGSIVLGLGFTLDPDDAQEIIVQHSSYKSVLFPYLNGEDLNSHYQQQPSRWIINFFDWSLDQCKDYPICL